MSSSGIFSEIKKHPLILAMVLLVHMGLIFLLSTNLSDNDSPPMPTAQKHNIINAQAIDANKFDEREKQKKLAAQKEKHKLKQEKLNREKLKKEKLKKEKLEKDRLKKAAAEKKKQQLAIAKKKEQERKLAAEKKSAEKLAAAKLAREAAEKKELERVQKEKQRLEAEKREAEKKKKLAEEAEKKRLAEEDRQRRIEEKAELERSLLEEERREEEARKQAEYAAKLLTLREQYILSIARKVENNWLRPSTTTKGQSCDVIVNQTMSGDVIDVKLQSCSSDNAFQRSVERAVRKASPLPSPPNPDVFDREIYFTFSPR